MKTTIRKSRIVLKKEVVDGLLAELDDFGIYFGDVWSREEYRDVFANVNNSMEVKKKRYMEKIMPCKIAMVEKLLEDYLKLP